MKRIDIKITYKCNNNCKFCVQGDKRYWCQNKPADEIKKILETSKDNYGEVIFTGGEPTIRPDIIELIKFAKKAGYKIQIQTNGRMFAYKDFCREIIKAGADIFAISIHGHNAELHDYLTGAKGSFAESTSGIRNLLSFAKLTVTNTVINKANFHYLPEIARFLVDLGVPQYQFAFPHILGSTLTNKDLIVPRKKEIVPYLKKGLEVGIKNKRRPKTEAIPYCFLIGYEDCAAENDVAETKVFGIELTESFNRWRKEEGRRKGPRCKECKYFQCCEGPWREYPEFFGWDEFIPVR